MKKAATPQDLDFSNARSAIQEALKLKRRELNLSAFSRLHKLPDELRGATCIERLFLTGTRIDDISLVATLPNLRELYLNGTPVWDLSPVLQLKHLEVLWLAETRVSDLRPIATLETLARSATVTPLRGGLRFEATPAASDAKYAPYALLDNPERTFGTMNAVRSELELHPIVSDMHTDPSDHPEDLKGASEAPLVTQPATFKFLFRDQRFHAEAQKGPAIDQVLAEVILTELKEKARRTRERLKATNAPAGISEAITRLLRDLDARSDDISPGLILMRSRTIDAYLASFDSQSGHRELGDEVFAALSDIAVSLGDLKACFPLIARIEAARLAQDLLQKDIEPLLQEIAQLQEVAESSDLVAPSARDALTSAEPEIEALTQIIASATVSSDAQAIAVEKRASTIAQSLLDIRNFAVHVLKKGSAELGMFGSAYWQKVKKTAPAPLAEASVALMVASLVHLLLGPLAAIASFVATYKPLATRAKSIVDASRQLLPKDD